MGRKVMYGLAAAAAVVLLLFATTGFPPIGRDGRNHRRCAPLSSAAARRQGRRPGRSRRATVSAERRLRSADEERRRAQGSVERQSARRVDGRLSGQRPWTSRTRGGAWGFGTESHVHGRRTGGGIERIHHWPARWRSRTWRVSSSMPPSKVRSVDPSSPRASRAPPSRGSWRPTPPWRTPSRIRHWPEHFATPSSALRCSDSSAPARLPTRRSSVGCRTARF